MQVADRLLNTPPYPFAELGMLKRKAERVIVDTALKELTKRVQG